MWEVEEGDAFVTNTRTMIGSAPVHFFKCIGYGVCKIASKVQALTFQSLAVSLRTTRFKIQKLYMALALR